MKRILTIILAFFLCLTVSAQIERNIFGMELGVTSYDDAESMLRDKGLYVEYYTEGVLYAKDVTLGQRKWDDAMFQFFDNKLCSVTFGKRANAGNKKEIAEEVKGIDSVLRKKYAQYLVVDNGESLSFTDYDTMVSLTHKKLQASQEIYGLVYSDCNLLIMQTDEILNEV